ncbi:MAG: Fe-S cluster assembly ATPase SufC [Candidatus Nealsonbacteria bacterium]|nr:Fe-S cluster assembly ATPase SufC [Candidatus Nealsonbacteria bacterium]
MLILKNLSAKINNKDILRDISFTFEEGKVYALMGPNGSGKSTLAFSVMGHPSYSFPEKSKIIFDGKNITRLKPERRAKLGIFLSFQSPLALSGVNVFQLLRYASQKKIDPLSLKEKLEDYSRKLKVAKELLERPLNEGFSGGERKKMEILQAAILNPRLAFFDEIDTGVDVDALKTIALFLNDLKKGGKTFVLITHYNRILKHIKPDAVLVMKEGRLVRVGDGKLVDKIEKEGYEKI